MTLYHDSAMNKRKTWLLMTGFFMLVMLVGYAISWYFDSPVILIIAVIFSCVSSFVSYWWSDKIVLSMSGATLVDHNNGREIYHLVENLCITAGLPLPKIYIIEDSAPNAFATGRDPQHAAIALTTGILAKLDKAEVQKKFFKTLQKLDITVKEIHSNPLTVIIINKAHGKMPNNI